MNPSPYQVHDDSHGGESCPGVRNTDEVTEDNIGQADSDQRVSDPSERCNTLKEIGEGRFAGRPMEIEESSFNNTELVERASITELRTRQTYPCDVSGTHFQEAQKGTYTTIKIEQEGDDDVDDEYDKEASLTGEFLADCDVDLHNDGEHYNCELIPGYTIDNNPKVWKFYLSF